jgi:sodium/bile acid cotransporter 7
MGSSNSSLTDKERNSKWREMFDGFQSASFPTVPQIEAEELKQKLDSQQPVTMVDCRDAAEMKVSMIPGAISKADFEKCTDVKDELVVCYCTIGYRSGFYVKKLLGRGINAVNLVGSILAWTHISGTILVDKNGDETKSLHTYGKRWGLAPKSYKCEWYMALSFT